MGDVNSDREMLDILVVGAGFAGIYQLDRLRSLGYSVKVAEAGSELGGVWYWNCYPGARVDTQGPIYQFSRDDLWKDWEFSELFPGWAEVRSYFDYLERKLDLKKDIWFDTKVLSTEVDDDGRAWTTHLSDGRTVRSRYLVMCLGFAARPLFPNFPGMDSFAGEAHHTALWPQAGVDLTGKRVAVIGSGASGIQVVQEAAASAAQVTQFIRTPNLALPMNQRTLTPQDQAEIKAGLPERFAFRSLAFAGFDIDFDPRNTSEASTEDRDAAYAERWNKGGFHFWLGGFQDLLFDEDANDKAYAFWRDKVRARIDDPATAETLAPTDPLHPFGVKRPSLEQNYYDVFNQDNVAAVNLRENPIASITPKGIRTADGAEHEFDLIVYATGFDSNTGGLTQIEIRGSDGTTLADKWTTGVDAYLGMATKGYPNLLFVYGPQSPSGFCNGPTCAEIQGDMIVDIIEYLSKGGYSRIEPTGDADEAWTAHVEEAHAPSLFARADSWYMGANVPGKKRQMLQYPAGLSTYRAKFDESKNNNFAGFQIA